VATSEAHIELNNEAPVVDNKEVEVNQENLNNRGVIVMSEKQHNVAPIDVLDPDDHKNLGPRWDQWIARLNQYFIANEIVLISWRQHCFCMLKAELKKSMGN